MATTSTISPQNKDVTITDMGVGGVGPANTSVVNGTNTPINAPGGVTSGVFNPENTVKQPDPIIKNVDSPISDTSGIRNSIKDVNSKISNINPNIPEAPVFGQYNTAQQSQIDSAGNSTGADYDNLIRQAQYEKEQGMAKSTVNAGERGGFMNSQYSGIAATNPTVGGNFIGNGGQLQGIKSQYDLNIQSLQVKKMAAVSAAKASMQQYIDSGTQQSFQNAITEYDRAHQAQQAQEKATADAQKAALDAQKASFDLSVPISQAGDAVQSYVLDQVKKYPSVIADYVNLGGKLADFNNLSADQITALISQNKDYQAAQATDNLGPGTIGEYQYAVGQGYKGSFMDYQKQKSDQSNSGLTDILKTLQIQQLQNTLQGTDSQRTAAGYADRIKSSGSVIDNLESTISSDYRFLVDSSLPDQLSTLRSDTSRQELQAETNFINAVLRRESGAAISKSEYDIASQQYFPRPGDDSKTLEQKKENRDQQLANLIRDAGPATSLSVNPGKVTIGDKQYDVGQEVTNPQGKKGIVNANGTITLK